MKLPFLLVPRSVYDDLRADLAAKDVRVKELTDTLLDLKLQGAQVIRRLTHAGHGLRLDAKPVSAIEQAIDDDRRCQTDPQLRARMLTWADRQLATQTMSEEQVLATLRTWSSPTAGGDVDDDELLREVG